MLDGRRIKVVLILSVVVPIGVLATLGLTGILQRPITIAETTTLDVIVWKRERPYLPGNIPGDYAFETNYFTDEIAFTEVLWAENYMSDWFGGGPATFLAIYNSSVSVSHGFVKNVQFNFTEEYHASTAYFHSKMDLSNLRIDRIIPNTNFHELTGNTKAFLSAVGVGEPKQVLLANATAEYMFHSSYNYTHQIEITSEVVYFNGTVFKKIVQPVQFVFGPDDNNSFEMAEEIRFGTHKAYLDGLVGGDPVDYYKIWLEQGQKVKVSLGEYLGVEREARVLNPEGQLIAYLSLYRESNNREAIINVESTGWWYIQVNSTGGAGPYALEVSKD